VAWNAKLSIRDVLLMKSYRQAAHQARVAPFGINILVHDSFVAHVECKSLPFLLISSSTSMGDERKMYFAAQYPLRSRNWKCWAVVEQAAHVPSDVVFNKRGMKLALPFNTAKIIVRSILK
jgi:hypothetical protein